MAIKKVNTATLLRGNVYTMRHPDNTPQTPKESLRFTRGEPVVITDPKILALLERLEDEVTDGEGEVYFKDIFRIDRNVDAPDDDEDFARRRAERAGTADKNGRIVKKKPPPRRR